ncbi:hypothetical protein [Paracoccus sp. (in: a-proteobacteria)]|uniref:hypothetical protein n=1 Tax=Paracoccus sp. TaxID=267 RepID=UPI00321F63CA
MLIFWDRRLVFLATPKAGSTAIETALAPLADVTIQRPAALKHADLARYRRHVEPWLQAETGAAFTTVALMREPIGWLRSWYRFRQRDDDEDPEHAMAGVSFADFALAYGDPGGLPAAQVGSQAGFLTEAGHRIDRIFRYEDMDSFTHFLEDRLGCEISLPHINVPPPVDVSLTPGQEERLRGAMQRDLQLYAELAGQG